MEPSRNKNSREPYINLFFGVLIPLGLFALYSAIKGLRFETPPPGLIILFVVTVFFGSILRFQLPRTKIHLTISDALIFLSLLLYGGSVAIILGTLEAGFTAMMLRRQGVRMSWKTVSINVLIATISVFASSTAVIAVFGPPELLMGEAVTSQLIMILSVMAFSQFAVNSVLVSVWVSIKNSETLWRVWNEYCFNALVMFLCGALMAGIATKAIYQMDYYMFIAVAVFFGLVYLTYNRYVQDVKSTAAEAQEAERKRAEDAEQHVRELEHYVHELQKSTEALRESREKFRHAAYHDHLTNLPNRAHFIGKITELIDKRSKEDHHRFAVMFLDLDRFKTLNESLGHSVGDRLITHVAARLSNIITHKGVVGRFGGDEFAILLNGVDGEIDTLELAERVRRQIAEPFSVDGRQLFTNASIGIAFGDKRYVTAEELLRDADIAMYHAKTSLSGITVFDPNMHARAVQLLELETDLRVAVKRKQFELFYQPIVTLSDGRIKGFEALVRWPHPSRGLISPADFIPLAETTGLIVPITRQLLRDACIQVKKWQEMTDEPFEVSVNLSGKHFEHPNLVEQVKEVVEQTKITPSSLKLEITESAVMDNAETAISTLKQIRETGIRVSIDDFGTGYSSLSYLHRFPIDTLKIDRSFVNTMEEGSENGEIVRIILALARALKLDVIAEGIESIHEFHQLRILGCEYGQGYMFSRPLQAKDIERMILGELPWRNALAEAGFGMVSHDTALTQLKWTQ
ncbi:MAG: EAL domain-containing protein [Acidobacteria bacterium]|nr:EAL domain-containing protein [Acidobacteriota bacterium]